MMAYPTLKHKDNFLNLPANNDGNGYVIRTMTSYYDDEEIYEAQKLRYEVFCRKLHWNLAHRDGREWDQYDVFALHFGAFTKEGIVGYARIIRPSPVGFMLQNEFRDTLGGKKIQMDTEHSVEISRLCVRESNVRRVQVTNGLYKAMYQWSKIHEKRYWYIVVEERYLRSLQKQCFPFRQIGPGYEYEKGVLSVPAVLDLEEGEEVVAKKRPQFFKWFRRAHLRWEEVPEFEMKGP